MNKTKDFIKSVYKGKTIGRILFNWQVSKHCASIQGSVLDLAGGSNASYYRYLPKNLSILRTNYLPGEQIDQVVDLNQPLPFGDQSQTTVLLFNALYIIKDQEKLFHELKRILAPGGKVFLASPFITPEIPEPHDFRRLTQEGLNELAYGTGFTFIKIYPYGERATAAAFLMHPLFRFNTIRLIVYAIALGIDRLTPPRLHTMHPSPIGYFCIIQS